VVEPRETLFPLGDSAKSRGIRLPTVISHRPHRDLRPPRPQCRLVAQAEENLSGTTTRVISDGKIAATYRWPEMQPGRCCLKTLLRSHAQASVRMLICRTFLQRLCDANCRGFRQIETFEALTTATMGPLPGRMCSTFRNRNLRA